MTRETLERVHLITCVGVDTEYAHLPHFIDHYCGLGIAAGNFHVILNAADQQSHNLARATELLIGHGIAAPEVWIAAYTSESMWAKRREIQARLVPPSHWVISADVDEFHEYPDTLATLLAECEQRGANCAQGVFIDRLAPEGRLVTVQPDLSIWRRFPIEADVQCTIGQTGTHHNWHGTVKVMALKGSLLPARGGHHPQPGDTPIQYLFGRHLATFPNINHAKFRFRVPLRVHHFKWTASMPDTLRRRLTTPGVSQAGAEYGQKLLNYFDQYGGIRLQDVPVRHAGRSRHKGWRRRLGYLRAVSPSNWYINKMRRLTRRALRKLTP